MRPFNDGGGIGVLLGLPRTYRLSKTEAVPNYDHTLTSYGIDPIVAMMFQGPIWFVYIAAVVQFFAGRPLKGSE